MQHEAAEYYLERSDRPAHNLAGERGRCFATTAASLHLNPTLYDSFCERAFAPKLPSRASSRLV
jgi:hypothetical protein